MQSFFTRQKFGQRVSALESFKSKKGSQPSCYYTIILFASFRQSINQSGFASSELK